MWNGFLHNKLFSYGLSDIHILSATKMHEKNKIKNSTNRIFI